MPETRRSLLPLSFPHISPGGATQGDTAKWKTQDHSVSLVAGDGAHDHKGRFQAQAPWLWLSTPSSPLLHTHPGQHLGRLWAMR